MPWQFWQPADGSGPAERLSAHVHPEGQFPASWSPDGKTLLFGDGQGLWTLRPDGDREPRAVLKGTSAPHSAALSPNGRWFAYVSTESGRGEVYVRAFPGAGSPWTISADGGSEPVWARNGRELFYRSGDRIMAVTVTSDATFSASKPRMLFAARKPPHTFRSYDVTPNGEFLMIEPGESDTPAKQINVVLNWLQEVRQRVASK